MVLASWTQIGNIYNVPAVSCGGVRPDWPAVMKQPSNAGEMTFIDCPPYQYKPEFCVHHRHQEVRVASVLEREVVLRFPAHYAQTMPAEIRTGRGQVLGYSQKLAG